MRLPLGALATDFDFSPPADIEETDDAFVVEIELPGVTKEDINVEISGRRLSVSGERKEKERKGVLRTQTRVVGSFRYNVTLPAEVTDEGVQANLDQGVLSFRVPKSAGREGGGASRSSDMDIAARPGVTFRPAAMISDSAELDAIPTSSRHWQPSEAWRHASGHDHAGA